MLALAGQSPFASLLRFSQARREVPFVFSLGGELPILEGYIDLLQGEADGAGLIVDYKTNRLDAVEDLEDYTEQEYGLQRLVYALAALAAGYSEVEVAFWYLRTAGGSGNRRVRRVRHRPAEGRALTPRECRLERRLSGHRRAERAALRGLPWTRRAVPRRSRAGARHLATGRPPFRGRAALILFPDSLTCPPD